MTIFLFLYAGLALSILAALSVVILEIGSMLARCPEASLTARPAAITVVTGFVAIGLGGISLITALVMVLDAASTAGLLAALGLVSLCLGLGFANAVATLRAVLARPASQA